MKWIFGMVTRIWYVWMATSCTKETTTTQEKNEQQRQQNNDENDGSHRSSSPQRRNEPSRNPHPRPLPPPHRPIRRGLHPPPRTPLRLVFLVHNLCILRPRICYDDSPALYLNYKLKSVAHLPWKVLGYWFVNAIHRLSVRVYYLYANYGTY